MKQRLIAAGLALALTAAACERKPPPATGATRVLTVPGFKTPESVKYDPDLDMYFVTNINGNPSAKDNNGFISRIRPDGTVDSLAFVAGGRGGESTVPSGRIRLDRKSTRLNSSHVSISYAVFCLKKKN